jgi:TorA maturation chaperone TorD
VATEEFKYIAAITESRLKTYGFFQTYFISIPDIDLVREIATEKFVHFLDACCGTGNINFKRGCACIKTYCSDIESRNPDDVLNELSVDRTRLLRGTYDKKLKPPYESLYIPCFSAGDVITSLTVDYRKAGILPDEDTGEMPDYIGIELDFMCQLCIREMNKWLNDGNTVDILNLELDFLVNHSGRWLPDYCSQAGSEAATDFYRGVLIFLDAFIDTEIKYLEEIKRTGGKIETF